eukprot:TRINITY_DN42125_c0_g1_i1.p1 TRINITY_DN42125_c0_g1~~TRINITY_DN42125_c0_g1_i1.p1  ORF type:complete len:287 (+),score=46.17 TRINITY_DN42125_c0_g1_i1:68-928(+)
MANGQHATSPRGAPAPTGSQRQQQQQQLAQREATPQREDAVSLGVAGGRPTIDKSLSGHVNAVFTDGSSYDGQFLKGQRHGYGVFAAGTNQYEGQWQEGRRHGWGRLTFSQTAETYYEGSWDGGLQHGEGKQVWGSGSIYRGQWRQGVMHGKGSMRWVIDGEPECWVGTWVNGEQSEGSSSNRPDVMDDFVDGPPREVVPTEIGTPSGFGQQPSCAKIQGTAFCCMGTQGVLCQIKVGLADPPDDRPFLPESRNDDMVLLTTPRIAKEVGKSSAGTTATRSNTKTA